MLRKTRKEMRVKGLLGEVVRDGLWYKGVIHEEAWQIPLLSSGLVMSDNVHEQPWSKVAGLLTQ